MENWNAPGLTGVLRGPGDSDCRASGARGVREEFDGARDR